MANQNLMESIEGLERKVSRGRADREEIFDLANAYREAVRPEAAGELLDQYLNENAPDWDVCRLCVESYREAKRMEDAVRVLNRWASRYRDRAQFWVLRGVMFEEMGDWDSALNEHLVAGRIAPHMAEAHYRQGVVFMQLGRHDDALQAFKQTLRLRPRLVPALINMGLVQEALKRPREAAQTFDRALSIDPQSTEAHLNLGALLGETGQMEAALEHCERALELD
ncbi:MAG: tetratricopeptide repeat protein, partial [Candidatus Eisenbacteria sp.]|nr:tetratricopeptide repeat protein [Candidatus Eisenbacteria bacterium]